MTFFVERAARLLNGIKDYGQHARSDRLGSGEANSGRREVAQARRALGNKTLSPWETSTSYERKKRCELSVVVSLGGERGESVLSVAMTG